MNLKNFDSFRGLVSCWRIIEKWCLSCSICQYMRDCEVMQKFLVYLFIYSLLQSEDEAVRSRRRGSVRFNDDVRQFAEISISRTCHQMLFSDHVMIANIVVLMIKLALRGLTVSPPRVINFKFLLQPQHIMRNLAFHSLLGQKMIILPILTTSLIHFALNGWENVLLNSGDIRVNVSDIQQISELREAVLDLKDEQNRLTGHLGRQRGEPSRYWKIMCCVHLISSAVDKEIISIHFCGVAESDC